MSVTQFIFDNDQLNRLFPYYILLNKDFSIEGYGSALGKIIGKQGGQYFKDIFKVIDSVDSANNISNINASDGYTMKISIASHPDMVLSGALEYLKQAGKYFFSGNLVANAIKSDSSTNNTELPENFNFPDNFFERVVNELPSDVVVLDTDHTYRFINPRAIKDAELREWMIGKTDEDYCNLKGRPLSLAEERRRQFNEVMRTRKQRMWEERMSAPDGSTHYLLRNMYPVLDNDQSVEFVIGYGLDITDRKIMEDQLRINEKRYRDLYNFSPALIYTHSTDGTLLSVNPAIFAVLGYTADEVVNKNIKVLLPGIDKDRIQVDYIDKVNGAGTSKGIFRATHKNGNSKYLFYQNYKVEEQDSQPYIIGFSQDITERILAEKELLLAKRNTEKLSKVKDTFLANMSHELRTPMNGILGVTNLLSKTVLNDQQTHYAHLITDSVNNLLTIINDILDMEKISSGNIEFEHRAFKVVDKVASIVHSFEYKANQKQVQLKLNNTLPSNLVVIGDQHRLAQILNNLLSNAIKFTNKGSVIVTTGLLHYTDADAIVEFVVEDTGIGIDESRLPTIFEPFVKASTKFAGKFGGTGLGLSISKNLAEMQGGSIELKSKVGVGSTFTFNLPFKRGQLQALSETKAPPLSLSKIEKKILVAEDIELNQFLVKTMLESWGGSVDIAVNGKEAIEKVNGNTYDLILMDIQMPEMDGITATRHIRELNNDQKANIPIIAFTANTLQGDAKLYKDAGMNDYITKPYTEEKLHEKISEVLNLAEKEQTETPSAPDTTQQIVLENEERLYSIAMIEAIGKNNPAFIDKMIVMFVDFVVKDFDKLKEAASQNNWKEVGQIAHKLKSTFGNMGVTSLVPYVIELESQAGEPNQLIEKLDNGLAKVFKQMKADYPDLFTN
ncbi:PAS domain-containing hybrid sensor histidine kinase/response regulator [Mucilaginibacter auburnensis]|uniref:histidine kinase n=1 Tax=Mucilaginibacter auburnensis TaxID=1457233 RepID=A0A2H9VL07_9SPHI|nr:PAS domain-containing hybrid sensor histidine kinase/response regulator [Mucilaginibacter auburnensis]PJJ79031.1 PAS domain S-box-containing protein [Mucilaginibacter auburnensis]